MRLFAIKELFSEFGKDAICGKKKYILIGNYIIKHSKVVLPAVVVVAVAVTVSVSLSMNNRHSEAQQEAQRAHPQPVRRQQRTTTEDVSLVANEEGAIYTLVATYYNAMATGDERDTSFRLR